MTGLKFPTGEELNYSPLGNNFNLVLSSRAGLEPAASGFQKERKKEFRKKKCFERLELRRYSLNITVFLIILSHIYVPFLAVPLPPINLKASDCKDWTAKLSWVADPSNNASITHYLIEQESSENPVIFISLLTVTNPNTTSVFLKLSKGSVPRFRVKAVNNIGASRPSLTVETSCKNNEAKVGTYMYFTKIPWKH